MSTLDEGEFPDIGRAAETPIIPLKEANGHDTLPAPDHDAIRVRVRMLHTLAKNARYATAATSTAS